MKYNLLDIQKKVYSLMKKRATSYEIPSNQLFQEYQKDFDFYSEREFSIVHHSELIKSIEKSDICYLGDFHTFDQSSRTLLRILKSCLNKGKRLDIGLEMVHSKDQHLVDSYLEGDLTSLEFLESINYTESWRFPWAHYSLIFEFAKKYKFNIFALNSEGSLEERDEFASLIIRNHFKKTKSSLLILFGELHILPDKLPQYVKKQLDHNKIKHLILHQNMDSVYWNSLTTHEEVDDFKLVKFSEEEYCLINSPAWMKYESLIYWYEGIVNDFEFDVHQILNDIDRKKFTENPLDKYLSIRENIHKYFDLNLSSDGLQVYEYGSKEFLVKELEQAKSSFYSEKLLKLLKLNQSFYWSEKNKIFCSHYSVNHLCRLVGLEIGWRKVLNDKMSETALTDLNHYFLTSVYIEIIAHVCVRIINPFYKCNLYLDFRKSNKEGKVHRIPTLIEQIENGETEFNLSGSDSLLERTIRELGDIFGDHVFSVYKFDQPQVFGEDIRKNLMDKVTSYEGLVEFLQEISKNKYYKMRKKRVF